MEVAGVKGIFSGWWVNPGSVANTRLPEGVRIEGIVGLLASKANSRLGPSVLSISTSKSKLGCRIRTGLGEYIGD
jgi:hypothetical protein